MPDQGTFGKQEQNWPKNCKRFGGIPEAFGSLISLKRL